MHIKKRWNRREFIRAAGLSGIAGVMLPFLPTFSAEAAESATGLKRLLLLTTGNGTVLDAWRNNGSGNALTHNAAIPDLTGPILSPLNKHRENLLLLDGIDITAAADRVMPPGSTYRANRPRFMANNGHSGHSVVWTGLPGTGELDGSAESKRFPKGASIDQIFNDAKGEGRKTIQSSIWAPPRVYGTDTRWYGSYDASGSPLKPEHSPQALFDRIFKDGFDNNVPASATDRRKLAIDLLRSEFSRVRKVLPSEDKYILDKHLDGLNDLEKGFGGRTLTCQSDSTTRPTSTADNYFQNLEKAYAEHAKVISSSFACDQVQAAHFVLAPENGWGAGTPIAQIIPPGFGQEGIHTTSHARKSNSNAKSMMTAYQNYMAVQFSRIIDQLEADGVLEETLIVWGMGMGDGDGHANRNAPFVVYQGSNGPMKTNRYLNYGNHSGMDFDYQGLENFNHKAHGGETNNNLLVSILHAMDMPEVKVVGSAEMENGVGTSVLCNPNGRGLEDTLMGA